MILKQIFLTECMRNFHELELGLENDHRTVETPFFIAFLYNRLFIGEMSGVSLPIEKDFRRQ